MRLHRFYIQNTNLKDELLLEKDINKDTIHQIINVFRAKEGDGYIFFNCLDNYDYRYELKIINKNTLSFNLRDKIEKTNLQDKDINNITLCQSIIKKDNFELIIRQMVEIGLKNVIPLITDRSESKILNLERIEKIIIEATEQSGRNDIMKIEKPLKIKNLLEKTGEKIVFDIMKNTEKDKVKNNNSNKYLLIGPEGGWTDEERKLFIDNGFYFEHMPTYTLRAETAAIASVIYMLK